MSTFDVFELAPHLAYPNPALDTSKKIAVLVSADANFEHSRFLELCTRHKGLNVREFDDCDTAKKWLAAKIPPVATTGS